MRTLGSGLSIAYDNERPDPKVLCLREGFKTDRTACVNRIRGLLAEFGLVFGKSAKVLREVLSDVLEDASNELAGLASHKGQVSHFPALRNHEHEAIRL